MGKDVLSVGNIFVEKVSDNLAAQFMTGDTLFLGGGNVH